MASLPKDPKGWELEDLVAAHFAARGAFVETGVTERSPDELLELDLVWTDYHRDPAIATPVEVKSGAWGLGDLFKFFGWTRYLGLPPGVFVHREPCGRVSDATLHRVHTGTEITLLPLPAGEDPSAGLASFGLLDPPAPYLTSLWRYYFWAHRRLLRSLKAATDHSTCPDTAREAKRYYHLLNDAVFFLPDARDRVGALLDAHFGHRELGLTAAQEIETGTADFTSPPQTATFKRAYYTGSHFAVHCCLYLAHRARLAVLKAVVDYWLARRRGDIPTTTVAFGQKLIDITAGKLSIAMANGAEQLAAAPSFSLFPVFWQTFLWTWGGFLLRDRLDREYAALAAETGVTEGDVPLALSAFDRLFPVSGGWFRQPADDTRTCLILMPAAIRGLGAFRRLLMADIDDHNGLGLTSYTPGRLASDQNALVHLLECADDQLHK